MQRIDEAGEGYWRGKRVLVRVGFDIGSSFTPSEEFRIASALPTIRFLLEQEARVILLNHNGRPGGKFVPALSNSLVAQRLALLLGQPVTLVPLATKDIQEPLALLENLRFHPGEEEGSESFARSLAALGDAYVNEAFSNCHRVHASMVALPRLLPHFAGFHLTKELSVLGEARDNPVHPLLLIIGGLKVETKIKVVRYFWDRVDGILLGGALANTLLHCKGIAVGKSMTLPSAIREADSIVLTDTRLHLPVDVRAGTSMEEPINLRLAPVGRLNEDEFILDIGPDTEALFDNLIKSAKMIIWNGPLGKYEIPEFSQGTEHLFQSLISSNAKVIAGGGETIEFLEKKEALSKFFFVSTGGGAMLAFLAGDVLPGIQALNT